MALDGGASTQMAYRSGDQIIEPMPAAVTVPTAILVRQTQSARR
jgi:exopolysaccharide biosynthesis protein